MRLFVILPAVLFVAVFSLLFSPNLSFAQGVQTSGGVDVDGSWYLGEGLKVGDYFEYSLCEIDLNDCAPVKIKFWIRGEIKEGTEELWDTEVVVEDGNQIIKGSIGLGKTAPEPITFDESLRDYAIGFKSSLSWMSAFATGNVNDLIHGPKEFRDNAWGKIGAIGGAQLIPLRAETISVGAGRVDTVVVGWYSGNNNQIWLVDDFPFPVKARTYAWVTTGVAPIMYEFELLKYQENVSESPFKDVVSTPPKNAGLGCTTEFLEYKSGRISTNTSSMMIQYNYSPKAPKEGCNLDWKINFMNKYNDVEFIDQVHYDLWVVDDKGTRLRSLAEDRGRADLFNGFGQVHILMPIEEKAGEVQYAIFVYGTGPEYEVPDSTMAGYAIIPITINANPLLDKIDQTPQNPEIPAWIKNNAGWWADGSIDDNSFVQGIQWLIQQGIMKITT